MCAAARGLELNEARLRMATLPAPADEVIFTPGLWVPLVVVDRVHILPGIPKLFTAMVQGAQVGVRARGGAFGGRPCSPACGARMAIAHAPKRPAATLRFHAAAACRRTWAKPAPPEQCCNQCCNKLDPRPQERFAGPLSTTQSLYTHMGEGDLADPLAAVAAAHPAVSIGSYPNTADGGPFKVKLAFAARDPEALAAAVAAARAALPDLFEHLPSE